MALCNAAKAVWPNVTALACGFHDLKAKKAELLLGRSRVVEGKADFSLAQLSWNQTVFKTTSAPRVKRFVEYLKPLLFGRHSRQYKEAAPNLASPNIGLKWFNEDLKGKWTKRNEFPVSWRGWRLRLSLGRRTISFARRLKSLTKHGNMAGGGLRRMWSACTTRPWRTSRQSPWPILTDPGVVWCYHWAQDRWFMRSP